MAKKNKKGESKVIPFPGISFEKPPEPDEVTLLDHPDVQVVQAGEGFYRIRVGEVELTYDCSYRGAWYLYLPGHEQKVGYLTTDQYNPGYQPFMINIDKDETGRAIGIEIV